MLTKFPADSNKKNENSSTVNGKIKKTKEKKKHSDSKQVVTVEWLLNYTHKMEKKKRNESDEIWSVLQFSRWIILTDNQVQKEGRKAA